MYTDKNLIQKKYKLMDDFFSIGSNSKPKETRTALKNIKDFVALHGKDEQLLDIISIAEVDAAIYKKRTHKEYIKISREMVHRLENAEKWDLYDLRIATRAIANTGSIKRCNTLSSKLLAILDRDYKNEGFYEYAKVVVHATLTSAFFLFSYFEVEDSNEFTKEYIEKQFNYHIDYVLSSSSQDKFPIAYAIALVRKGYLYNDHRFVDKGYKIMSDLKERQLINLLKQELDDYNLAVYNKLGKKNFMAQFAQNAKIARITANLTIEQVEGATTISASKLSKVENATGQLYAFEIYELAKLTGVTYEELMDAPKTQRSEDGDKKRQQLIDRIGRLSDDNVDIVLDLTKALLKKRQ